MTEMTISKEARRWNTVEIECGCGSPMRLTVLEGGVCPTLQTCQCGRKFSIHAIDTDERAEMRELLGKVVVHVPPDNLSDEVWSVIYDYFTI